MKIKNWISVLVVLCLALASVPMTTVSADVLTKVMVSAPENIPTGGTFVARLNVDQVTNLNAFQIQVNYNPNVIQMVGAEGGRGG